MMSRFRTQHSPQKQLFWAGVNLVLSLIVDCHFYTKENEQGQPVIFERFFQTTPPPSTLILRMALLGNCATPDSHPFLSLSLSLTIYHNHHCQYEGIDMRGNCARLAGVYSPLSGHVYF